jgi:hypothetical protein
LTLFFPGAEFIVIFAYCEVKRNWCPVNYAKNPVIICGTDNISCGQGADIHAMKQDAIMDIGHAKSNGE